MIFPFPLFVNMAGAQSDDNLDAHFLERRKEYHMEGEHLQRKKTFYLRLVISEY